MLWKIKWSFNYGKLKEYLLLRKDKSIYILMVLLLPQPNKYKK